MYCSLHIGSFFKTLDGWNLRSGLWRSRFSNFCFSGSQTGQRSLRCLWHLFVLRQPSQQRQGVSSFFYNKQHARISPGKFSTLQLCQCVFKKKYPFIYGFYIRFATFSNNPKFWSQNGIFKNYYHFIRMLRQICCFFPVCKNFVFQKNPIFSL